MMMVVAAAGLVFGSCNADSEPKRLMMKTSMGDMVIELYDQTPIHRDNFLSLVEQNYFDSLLFHRVIENFMIQGGDPDSRNAQPGDFLGEGGPDYTVKAEFRSPEIFHKRGVLAAAREGDAVNPQKRSSASQFYIVWGNVHTRQSLEQLQERTRMRFGRELKLTEEQIETYTTMGGTPHLDGEYTIFGEVVEGLEVVDAIQRVATDLNDRPIEDVRIITVEVIE